MNKYLTYFLPIVIVLSPLMIQGPYPDMTILTLSIFTGIGYVFYFNFENGNKDFHIPLSILFFLLPLSYGLEILELYELKLFISFTSIVSIFTVITYALRYLKKPNKNSRNEIFKFVSIIQVCACFSLQPGLLTPSNILLAVIYFANRFGISIKNMNMIKNALIGLFFLISVFFVVYANIKANEADKQRIWIEMQYQKARENEVDFKETITNKNLQIDSLSKQLKECRNL